MKKLKLSLTVLLMFVLAVFVSAQEAAVATGGDASGDGGSASYSIGQVFCETNSSSSGSVTAGVQQPYEIFVKTGIEEAKDVDLGLMAYPNPTVDVLTLKVSNYRIENLSYTLYDLSGKLLEQKNIVGNITQIEMASRVSSIYFVKIIDRNKTIKTFKIVKK